MSGTMNPPCNCNSTIITYYHEQQVSSNSTPLYQPFTQHIALNSQVKMQSSHHIKLAIPSINSPIL